MQLGDSWVTRVDEALTEASYLLLVATPASLKSRFVKLEYTSVLATIDTRDTVLVPVIAEPCDLPILLRGLIFVDLTADREQGFRELVEFFGKETTPALESGVERHGTGRVFTDATRREIRVVATHCLDETAFAEFLVEAGIDASRVRGRTHHDHVFDVVHFMATDGQLELLTRILEEEKRAESEERLARLRVA